MKRILQALMLSGFSLIVVSINFSVSSSQPVRSIAIQPVEAQEKPIKKKLPVKQVKAVKPPKKPVVKPKPVIKIAPKPVVKPVPVKVTPPISTGSHQDWMAAAGISPSDYAAVEYIISHESGWRYWVVNSEGSGATGLCQALPGYKMASAGSDYLTNPVTQLRWCHSYAQERYGGWWGAYNHWTANSWW